MTDSMGRKYEYEEGADMMIENGGNYKRWPGVVCPIVEVIEIATNRSSSNTTRTITRAKASHRIR